MHEVIKDVRTTTIREVVEDVTFEAQIETVVLNTNPDQQTGTIPGMSGMPGSGNAPVGSKRISSGTAVVNSTDGQSTIIATFYKEHGNQLVFNTPQPDLYFAKVCSTLPTFINTINNL